MRAQIYSNNRDLTKIEWRSDDRSLVHNLAVRDRYFNTRGERGLTGRSFGQDMEPIPTLPDNR